jgi:hypothetical protein
VEELASNLSTYKDQLREVSSPPSLDPACPLGLSLRSCVGSAFLRRVLVLRVRIWAACLLIRVGRFSCAGSRVY